MKTPRIAFVTTIKGRTHHLKQTLPKNLADNADYENAVFVVLNYGTQDDLVEYLRKERAEDLKSGRLVLYTHKYHGPFHMAHAKNMAHRCAILEGAEILVTQDADNYTGEKFAEFIENAFREPGVVPGIFMCPNYLQIKSMPYNAARPVRGYAGRLAIWAQTFIKVGGYDEIYDTWRGEDIDMNFRLQRMGYSMRYVENKYLHAIGHNAEVRFKEYPHARIYETTDEVNIMRARKETVVNNGNFGVGTVYRNFDSEPIILKKIPTRVFGIGLHKTATTSLNNAFKLLGLDSFHWGTGEAPMIWYEMEKLGRSKTLEQWYALSDLPIPLLYQQLDKAYPGSKFILTMRDERAWLRSVNDLWNPRFNHTRHLWDIYPFSNHIHTMLYGQKDFDAEIFLARYRRHNAEVQEYFKSRPNDLLVLNMDDGVSWPALCNFLDRPIPDAAYPYANQTSEIILAVTT